MDLAEGKRGGHFGGVARCGLIDVSLAAAKLGLAALVHVLLLGVLAGIVVGNSSLQEASLAPLGGEISEVHLDFRHRRLCSVHVR